MGVVFRLVFATPFAVPHLFRTSDCTRSDALDDSNDKISAVGPSFGLVGLALRVRQKT